MKHDTGSPLPVAADFIYSSKSAHYFQTRQPHEVQSVSKRFKSVRIYLGRSSDSYLTLQVKRALFTMQLISHLALFLHQELVVEASSVLQFKNNLKIGWFRPSQQRSKLANQHITGCLKLFRYLKQCADYLSPVVADFINSSYSDWQLPTIRCISKRDNPTNLRLSPCTESLTKSTEGKVLNSL